MKIVKRKYLVFAGYQYYPGGGFNDFVGMFDTREEAEAKAGQHRESSYDWSDIVVLEAENLAGLLIIDEEGKEIHQ